MFLDASAIVAIVGDEEDAGYLIAKIEMSKKTIYYSSLSIYEAVISLARKKRDEAFGDQVPIPLHLIDLSQQHIDTFIEAIGAREMAIGSSMHRMAIEVAAPMGVSSPIPHGSILEIVSPMPVPRRISFPFFSRATTFRTPISRLHSGEIEVLADGALNHHAAARARAQRDQSECSAPTR